MLVSAGQLPTMIEDTASRPHRAAAAPALPAQPMAYRRLLLVVRTLLRVFFRRVEVLGRENVPGRGGGLIVAWHPNGLVDPALILATCPRAVAVGARHGLFRWPLLGSLMRGLGTVPIYRRQDLAPGPAGGAAAAAPTANAANAASLEALAQAMAEGRFVALFPEGDSHDRPRPMALRTGAARLYLRACELTPPDAPPPVIVPVGLFYNDKEIFRSNAAVVYHPPLTLPEEAAYRAAVPEGEGRERVRRLTRHLETVLERVVYATDSWQEHHLLHRMRKAATVERWLALGVAQPPPADAEERLLGFARVWTAYRELRRRRPQETERLLRRLEEYDRALRALGLDDDDLDRRPLASELAKLARLLAQVVVVYLLLPSFFLLGLAVNLPAALAVGWIARRASARRKDEASIKLLAGAVVFPLTWLALAALSAAGWLALHRVFPGIPDSPLPAAAAAFLVCALGGAVALRYERVARETWRAVQVGITRRRRARAIARLRRERHALYGAAMTLLADFPLPERVDAASWAGPL
ncbi:MAG TPA: 1-acyl-sn-glycerol-3-phosphate acyltransferase [Thermoanaerobaculia bacterium]|nr:1-acyl-sn-glycerol-3-phosphate acyltransferase [Thermoanaerobaculia bacterium]